jgi:hypothetical protein
MASSGRAFFKPAHASDTCFATVPGLVPRCPAIIRFAHPLNPQTSDSTSYPPAFADHRQASVPPCTRVRAAGPVPGGSPATPSGRPAGRTRFRRRCSSIALRTATAHSHPRFVSGRQPAIMSRRTAASRRHPGRRLRLRAGPQARPQSGEDLPTGRLGDVDGDDADIRCGLVVKLHGGVFWLLQGRPFVTPAARRARPSRELGSSGAGEGLLLRVAQVTTTHTGPDSGSRGTSPACRSRSGWCQVPDLTREVALPWSGQASHPAPAVPVRPRRSLSGHHVPSSGQASIRQAGPAICIEGSSTLVACSGGLPYAHQVACRSRLPRARRGGVGY